MNSSNLPRIDFDRSVFLIGTSRHLDNVEFFSASGYDDGFRAVSAVDQSRQSGVKIVDCGMIQGVDVHTDDPEYRNAATGARQNL